ncbi:hypothetical protein [Metabacillus fastidiosus]|uniref:hypothetical protein n=1 Tax=Metabacillus fastidiosus TaxID=1458 RepID=UPI000ADCEF84|nr:hypothetical protein [Metabacillus fastidiosus]MED4462063.1 hypothetical protein [Metabacillus fastidiosus]
MIRFICEKCGKVLDLEDKIYQKAYKDHEFCLSCRPGHGGFREGAGRPAIGITKKVSITLPTDTWERIEKEKGKSSMSAFLRDILVEWEEKRQ